MNLAHLDETQLESVRDALKVLVVRARSLASEVSSATTDTLDDLDGLLVLLDPRNDESFSEFAAAAAESIERANEHVSALQNAD